MELILKASATFSGRFGVERSGAVPEARRLIHTRRESASRRRAAKAEGLAHSRTARFLEMATFLRLVLIALGVVGLASTSLAQVQVRTLGGGRTSPSGPDAGYVDGNTLQSSQFNFPSGAVVDSTGNLFVADRNNGAVRKLDVAGNRATTILAGLDKPVAVAIDRTNNLYVLTEGDGLIRWIDRFGNVSTNKNRFVTPTALTLDPTGLLYVTEARGTVVRFDPFSETTVIIRDGLSRPNGIAVLDSGLLAVSDTDSHRVLFIDPASRRTVQQVGTGAPGFRDGSLASAQFNQPHHLARAPDGSVLVADRLNHRVRLIRPDSAVVTLYGVDPTAWEGPPCVTCNPIILPGWFDNTAEFAEAREPVGVAVGRDGKVYATEVYYHLVREVTGAGLTAEAGGSGSAANLVVLPPLITPDSGYFPLGQDITVVNPNTNAFFNNVIYYTTNESDPNTSSFRLALSNNVGTIRWRETTRDLASLRVVAFVGTRASEVIKGKPATTNAIGVTRDIAAGIGSTVVVPITVNLRPTDQLKSLQFRVEVSPKTATMPAIPGAFRPLPISTNDFIRVITSSELGGASTFSASAYTNGATRGWAITFIGTQANFTVKNFAVVAMLGVQIPTEAKIGDRYTIAVVNPSGTSDGSEQSVFLATMPARDIVIKETGYWVGDSSPASWYNADETAKRIDTAEQWDPFGPYGFGNQDLSNSDVNNAFEASLGLRVPYPFTELFDAMDAFPEDHENAIGGDGLIRFLDWQVILRRSLGLDNALWVRSWSFAGLRVVGQGTRAFLPDSPAEVLTKASATKLWLRQAVVSATPQENVQPGVQTDIPVYVTVGAGYRVSGLAFRATLYSEGGAPPLQQAMQFFPAAGLPRPIQRAGLSPSDLLCGWPLVPTSAFDPPLQNKTLLGHIRFTPPITARAGQTYTLHFSNADGSPDLHTQYDFETRPASVWLQTAALTKPEIISDEWKVYFFGSLTNELAQPDADPDHDGQSNLAEYQAGTDPASAESSLRLELPRFDAAKNRVVLRWLGAPGRSYTLEASPSLLRPDWKAVARDLPGMGAIQEFISSEAPFASQFYRLRLQTQDSLQ